MPWTAKQVNVFRALEHGWKPSGNHLSGLMKLGKSKLGQMADEGVSKTHIKAALKARITKR